MKKESINIVWFKRDLRVSDHAPLRTAALDKRPLLCVYLFEPSLMAAAAERLFGQLIEDYRRGFDGLVQDDIADVEVRLTAVLELLWNLFHQAPLAAALEPMQDPMQDAMLARRPPAPTDIMDRNTMFLVGVVVLIFGLLMAVFLLSS